ncbi:MAG: hypothetical protein NZT92_05885 [Abditibacteriales bacterium]|nr:hypothetical protein [Abditibacteriales bacterium]MDW8364824.1 hypothetical protein [Abditibacteriales bacterium]
MIRGHVNEAGSIVLEVAVRGWRGRAVLHGCLDTEFSGADLSLPMDVAITLGLDLTGKMEFELATGEEATQLLFTGIAQMGDEEEREVSITVSDSNDVLISREWLRGHALYANYVTGEVIIQPETRQRTRRRRR